MQLCFPFWWINLRIGSNVSKINLFFSYIFVTPFSVGINTRLANFHMECIELQSDIELKEKFHHVSLPDFHKPTLTKEKHPLLHSHTLFMSSLFGSMYICEQYLSRMKYMKSNISSKISDEHLESSLRMAATATEPAWCISFTKTRPNIPFVLCFCCTLISMFWLKNTHRSKLFYLNTLNLFCILYAAQGNFRLLSVTQASQKVGQQWHRAYTSKEIILHGKGHVHHGFICKDPQQFAGIFKPCYKVEFSTAVTACQGQAPGIRVILMNWPHEFELEEQRGSQVLLVIPLLRTSSLEPCNIQAAEAELQCSVITAAKYCSLLKGQQVIFDNFPPVPLVQVFEASLEDV